MLTLALVTSLLAAGQVAEVPYHVRLAYGAKPTTTMSVTWQIQDPNSQPYVEYGVGTALNQRMDGRRERYPYETGAIWAAKLSGLQPGTTYSYRVVDPRGQQTKVRTFRTADPNPEAFVFTAYGDHGVTPVAAQNVGNVLRERPAFHVLLGDVSYANGKQSIWDDYLEQVEPMTSTLPFMLTLGNHENEEMMVEGKDVSIGYVAYLARFTLPDPETHYTFDYGNARFVVFNSDDYRNAAQLAWLRDTLAAAREDEAVKWLVVLQHHPPYGSSKGRGDNKGLIAAVTPLFDRYKVDLVLCGHDHHYERQYPLRSGKPTSQAMTGYRKGEGTLYVIQGGGGRPSYAFEEQKPAICAYRETSNGYLRVTVRKTGPLTIEAKRVDGSPIETIEILD